MNYFDGLQDVESVKKKYRQMAMQLHPDLNPGIDDYLFKSLNDEYQTALHLLDGHVTITETGTYTYRYRRDLEKELVGIIDTVLNELAIPIGASIIEFYLIGNWIWVSGDTRPYKEVLKHLKFSWHAVKRLWYWRPATSACYHSNKTLDEIAARYGAERLLTKTKTKALK